MVFFEKIELAPQDSIFGVNLNFAAEKRPDKINLGVGSYKTADLKPYVLVSVKEAEKALVEQDMNKEYLPIEGEKKYLSLVSKLVLGDVKVPHAAVQSVGGTGALRIAGEFLKKSGFESIYLSHPTWDNHKRIFEHAGLQVLSYPYYNAVKRCFDFDALMESLHKMPKKSVVLLQACCHNPTGFDPTLEQWKAISTEMTKHELLPFFDFSYQGFGDSLEKDAAAIRHFASQGLECLIASSYSKNFGLYAERTGALFVLCGTEDIAKKVESQLKIAIRGNYSNPPCHGARIVATILGDVTLRKHWESELGDMRLRIVEMREALILALETRLKANNPRFEFMKKQKGMFSYTGLSAAAVEKLTKGYGIYLPGDGRINVAGINTVNLDRIAEAIIQVDQ